MFVGQTVLARYKITKLLDEGGLSKIYVARQLDQARDVVVKVVKDQFLSHHKVKNHFKREIHIMSRFEHPNAVGYIDSDPHNKQGPVLVMEYLRGVDLNIILQRQGRFTPERAGRLLVQLCDVLQSAHDAGIVHQDLKPGNLFVLHQNTPQETVKLMDFGLAKMSSMYYLSAEDLTDISLPSAAGTPEYISPEQARGADVDHRADIYSLGVIAYEMLTGRRPFEYRDPGELLHAHCDQPPPRFTEKGVTPETVSTALEKLILGCLAKSPEQRPQAAMQFALEFERALGRKLNIQRRSMVPKPASNPAPALPPLSATPSLPGSGNGYTHCVEASMPESMAMLKLRGFIQDLGGEILESIPGIIKVRVPNPQGEKSRGLFGWSTKTATQTASEMELRIEHRDPSQPSRMTVTLTLRPNTHLVSVEWRNRAKRIGQELQAYLMGR